MQVDSYLQGETKEPNCYNMVDCLLHSCLTNVPQHLISVTTETVNEACVTNCAVITQLLGKIVSDEFGLCLRRDCRPSGFCHRDT